MEAAAYFSELSVLSLLAAYAGGLALSFTPCVYPLVPVIIAVIGSVEEPSRRRNFVLSLSYVLGMAVTFSLLGVAAGLTGMLFGELTANPLVNLAVGNIIILFSLSTLGVLDLPVLRLKRPGGGAVPGRAGKAPVFAMGLASGFIGAACVGPVLGSILLYTVKVGNIAAGFILLFVFALGLGTTLLAAGVFAGVAKNLGKSSRAMDISRKLLAAGMLVLGQYFIFNAGRHAVHGWF